MALVWMIGGGLLLAQPPKGKPVPPRQPAFGMMQERLGLTDEQKDRMKQLMLERTKELLPLRNEMAVLKAEYHKLMAAEKPSRKEIDAIIDKQTALMNKMRKLQATYVLKMRKVLTEEQWLMIQAHRGMHGKGMKGAPYRYNQGHGYGPCGFGPTPQMKRPPMGKAPRWTNVPAEEK